MPQQPIDIDNYDHFSGADWNDVINNIFGNTNSDCYKLVQSYLDAQEVYLEKIDKTQDEIATTENDLATLEDEIEEWMAPFLNGIDRANFNPNFTPTQQAKFNTFVDDLKDVCIFKFIMSMLTKSNMPKLAKRMGTNYAKINLTITRTNQPNWDTPLLNSFSGIDGGLFTEFFALEKRKEEC